MNLLGLGFGSSVVVLEGLVVAIFSPIKRPWPGVVLFAKPSSPAADSNFSTIDFYLGQIGFRGLSLWVVAFYPLLSSWRLSGELFSAFPGAIPAAAASTCSSAMLTLASSRINSITLSPAMRIKLRSTSPNSATLFAIGPCSRCISEPGFTVSEPLYNRLFPSKLPNSNFAMSEAMSLKTIVQDRLAGLTLTEVAKKHRVSRATVCRLVNESGRLKKTGVAQIGNEERAIELVEGSNSRQAAA